MKNKIKLNISTFIVISIFLISLINDYFTYIIKFLPYFVSLSISGVIVITAIIFLIKKKILEIKTDFEKVDILFFVILFLIFISTFVFPDVMFDTINYHIYLQENPFNNKINYDFFAGKNINSFSYVFPDRIHYIFRSILGYRLGIICNYLIIIAAYYQIKSILKYFIESKNELLYSIMSIVIVFSFSILELVDNYYIDLFSLFIMLEIFKSILLNKFVVNGKYDSLKVYFLAMIFGFGIAIKISNGPMLLFFFVYFLIKTKFSFKKLHKKDYLFIILCGLFPFIIYTLYTFLSTGSPVFPYYNTIFKSKYFMIENWFDSRLGPVRIREKLLWPIYALFYPGRSVDQAIVEYMWGFGYIAAFIVIGIEIIKKFLKKENNKKIIELSIVTILASLIWSNMIIGYTRYGLIVLVLSYVLFFIILMNSIYNKKYIIFSILSLFLINNFIFCSYYTINAKQWWVFNNYYNQESEPYYIENMKRVFDYDEEYKLPENSVWMVANYNAGYITMINDNNNVISINSSITTDETSKIFNELTNGKRLFTVTDVLNFNDFIEQLNKNGYHIKNIHDCIKPKFMRYKEQLYIFEIEKNSNENSHQEVNTSISYKIDDDITSISFIYGLPIHHFDDMKEGYNLKISNIVDGKEKVVDIINLDEDGKLINYSIDYDFAKNSEVVLTIVNDKYETFDDRWFSLVNMTLERG